MQLSIDRPVQSSHQKTPPKHRLATVFVLLASVLVSGVGTLSAQDATDETAPAWPVVTVCVASVDRIMDNIGYVFGDVERPEIMDLIGAGLANVRDLEGLDRTKPGGLMIFVSEGLIPLPIPVGFLPVSDIGELGQTFASMGAQLKLVPGEENLYELIPRRGPTNFLVVQDGYAFIGQNEESIDRTFASPEEFAGPLANRYDICASANLKKTPKAVRDLILLTIKNSAQASMQRRDNEPEAVYNLRRSQSEGNLHFVENVLRDGEELTLGFKVDQPAKNASLELIVKATPNSAFAKELKEGIAKPSYFAPAIDDSVPLSGSLSVILNKQARKTMLDLFKLTEQESNRGLAGLPKDTAVEDIPGLKSTQDLFDAVRETIKEGHLDGFVQFFGEPGEKFVIIGGIRIVNAGAFGSGLSEVIEKASRTNANINVELGVDSYGDIVFHRLVSNGRNPRHKQMFGDESALYFGTDNQALWFTVGGDDAIPTLRAAIDRIAAGNDAGPKRGELAPFQVVVNLTEWININQSDRDQPGRFAALALQAFEADGSDVARLDARTLKDGFRVRIQVENGFLRLLGLAVAGRIDGNQDL
ncbi:MAG: hypothetical protein ISQ06_01735 [Planctomycetaceae bacterium]|nr:hypothetical protein [Planctomycetaceae bacterium]